MENFAARLPLRAWPAHGTIAQRLDVKELNFNQKLIKS
jgi:hypothetical protein